MHSLKYTNNSVKILDKILIQILIHSLQTNIAKKQMKYNPKIVKFTIINPRIISYA